MFHRHHSAGETARAEGVILDWQPSRMYRTKVRLVIGVKFDDGQTVEFTQETDDYCLPPAGDLAARLHALNQVPIPLSLHPGDTIPVCYDPADRTRMSVDEPTLHDAAIRAHIEVAEARRARADAILDASEPVHGTHPRTDGNPPTEAANSLES